MNEKRIRCLREGRREKGPIVYWMSRDQRVRDNWALIYSQRVALENRRPLAVVFCLAPSFLGAALRQYSFMLEGLKQVEKDLDDKNISFFLLSGDAERVMPDFIKQNKSSELISDFDPLKIKREWKKNIIKVIRVPFYEVDTRNIVPCWIASNKQEYAAYTIRPKIKRVLSEFLDEFPELEKHPYNWEKKKEEANWDEAEKYLLIDRKVKPVDWIKPGEKEAQRMLHNFFHNKINTYNLDRNDPTKDAVSNLSPYLHFGQISSQRIALEVNKWKGDPEGKNAFLEELIIRRELSDNFCFYNLSYDTPDSFPKWAKETLNKHGANNREFVYDLEQLENAKTHDHLWNATQTEMVIKGKMHGYMRMYWAKKILEWTKDIEEAMKIAVFLNDKYELDGRDTNGYTGIAWALGGVHDRAWFERPVFGKLRYMSYNGCKSKFDIIKYIDQVQNLES
jgi:deoxyribodipyrimidine photo-lyase